MFDEVNLPTVESCGTQTEENRGKRSLYICSNSKFGFISQSAFLEIDVLTQCEYL